MAHPVWVHPIYAEVSRPTKKDKLLSYHKRFLELRQSEQRRQDKSTENVMEVEGVETSNLGNFPFSGFKILGSFQIGAGVACVVLGIIDLCLYLFLAPDTTNETITSLTIISTPIWCGLWFVVSGLMGTCMSSKHTHTLSYFKVTFLILCILCAVLFGPVCCAVEAVISVDRAQQLHNNYQWFLPIIISFFAFNEIIFALIASAICCCCSPVNQTRVHVVLAKASSNYDDIEKRPLDSPEVYEPVPVNRQAIRQPKSTNYDNFVISRPPMENQMEDEVGKRHNGARDVPRIASEDKGIDLYQPRHYSDSYKMMKKLAMGTGRREW